jgi:phasin family protein
MTDTTSYIEMLRKFGADFGLPKPNIDQLVETQKKNIEALGQSAQVVAQGAQSVAQKQREVLEAGLREAATLAQGYKPLGKIHKDTALQTEFATKVFEIVVQNASTVRQSATEAVKIIQDRVKESFEDIRASVRPNKSV